jgi:hypothetical protein
MDKTKALALLAGIFTRLPFEKKGCHHHKLCHVEQASGG